MKVAFSKAVSHRIAGLALVPLLAISVFRVGVGTATRIAIAALLVYGALSLAGGTVEKCWNFTRSIADKHRSRYPRVAALLLVVLALFVVVLAFTVLTHIPGCRAAVSVASGGLLLFGGCLAGGRGLSRVWAACTRIASSASITGGRA